MEKRHIDVSAMIKQSSSYRLPKQNGLENAHSALTGSMRNSADKTMQSRPFEMLRLQCKNIVESPTHPLTH